MERRKKKRASSMAAIVIAALFFLVALFIAIRIVNKQGGTLNTAVELPALSSYKIEALGNGAVYYDGATLHAVNEKGRQLWSYSAGTSAGFRVGTGGVVTWYDNRVTVLNSSTGENLGSGKMDSNVLSAYSGEIYTAVQIGEEHNSTILLYECQGWYRTDSIEMNNCTVLDFGFFSNGSLFWIMTLDTEGTMPTCYVYTYRPGKSIAGSISDSQQVLYDVVFQSSKVRVVGMTYIKDYEYTGKEITDNRVLVYGWYLMSIDENSDNPLMAFSPVDDAGSSTGVQDIRLIRGTTDQSVRLPYPATKILVSGDAAYAFTNQYVMVCRLGSSTPERYELPMTVDSVLALTEDHRAIVTYNGSVYLIPLP